MGEPPELEFTHADRLPPALENLKKVAESTDWTRPPSWKGKYGLFTL